MDIPGITSQPLPSPDQASPEELPSDKQLLEKLCALSELLDAAHCATAYQLFAPEDLPDAWRGDLTSVRTLLRRLLRYAAEDDASLPIVLADAREAVVEGLGANLESELAYQGWFDDQACFALIKLGDLRAMLGPTCLELARAIVHHARLEQLPTGYRGMVGAEHETELPSDLESFLACFLLGWGVPVTNACFDPRTEAAMTGGWSHGTWRSASVGFPPDLAAWLLAVIYHASARDPGVVESRKAQLNTHQRAAFETYYSEFAGKADQLRATLRWGSPKSWPAPGERSLEQLPVDDHDDELEAAEIEHDIAIRKPNLGKPIFRVRPRKKLLFAFVGGILGSAMVMVFGLGLAHPQLSLALVAACAWFGGVVGYNQRGSLCSDPTCHTTLGVDATECPSCGGTIVGNIDSANDRLAAMERLELEAASKAAGKE